ncbi:MAG TPA: UDP-2,3-diacylglucosamine diphosphatase [Deltaproteobacteria bacterium]|nr:UDP-2,3-diacylglucosamine diphosphatase [Deltaproteobacteria bacterium]
MKAVFLSDAHLKSVADDRYGRLIEFLEEIKKGRIASLVDYEEAGADHVYIDDLFIAGDLFDFWFCRRDKIYPDFHLIIEKLVELKKTGVRIHLFEGNHDFFMKEYFHDVLDMAVFEECAQLELDGKKVFIAHGDTADEGDKMYKIFRKFLRSRAFYRLQRFIPAPVLWAIAGLSSAASKELNKENGDELFEKMSSFALDRLHEDCDAVILGHSHQAVLQKYQIEGRDKTFVALGDWINHYSFLYLEDGKFILSHYRPPCT